MDSESRTHEPDLRELTAELDGLRQLMLSMFQNQKDIMNERDKRYEERADAAKEASKAAQMASERAGEKTEMALKEYKIGSNEWRDTVKSLVASMPTRIEMDALTKMFDQKIERTEAEVRLVRETVGTGSGKSAGVEAMWNKVVQIIQLAIAAGVGVYIGKN